MSPRRSDVLVGLPRVVRFILRRDRFRLGVWVIGYCAVVVISAISLADLYADPGAVEGYATLFVGNPSLTVFAGPGHGLHPGEGGPTLGAILVNETQLWGAITLALMSVFMIVRSTRGEEELERAEVVGAAVVGRHAVAGAAVLVVAVAQAVIAAVSATGFALVGFPVVGSVALAVSITAVGWVFVAIALCAAQVFSTARGALGAALLVVVVAFVIRAVGDVTDSALRWFSPIGWSQGIRAFAGERWWVLAISLFAAVAIAGAGVVVAVRRDLGSGLIGARPGRAAAGLMARWPVLRVLRLQRGSVIGWSVGMVAIGAVFGSIADEIETMLVDQPQLADWFAQTEGVGILEAYLATGAVFIGLLAAGFAVASTLSVHNEERDGRAEVLWAGPRSRTRWLADHLVVSAVGALWMLLLGGASLGVVAAITTGQDDIFGVSMRAALATAPAVVMMLALTVGVWAWWPAWSLAVWAYVAAVVLIGYFAELIRIPQAWRNLSPFEHLGAVPAEAWRAPPAVVLVVLAASVLVVAVVGLGRRDLRAG